MFLLFILTTPRSQSSFALEAVMRFQGALQIARHHKEAKWMRKNMASSNVDIARKPDGMASMGWNRLYALAPT